LKISHSVVVFVLRAIVEMGLALSGILFVVQSNRCPYNAVVTNEQLTCLPIPPRRRLASHICDLGRSTHF